jgi:ComF family protein
MKHWARKLARLADLWLESPCPLCQRSTGQHFTEQVLCLDCQRQLQRLQLPDSEQTWQPPLPVFAWGAYAGSLKRALTVLKYNHQPQLAQPLGDWLAQRWLTFSGREPFAKKQSLVVVPIPLHAEKQRQRGYNQAELLAQAFCRRTGLALNADGLIRQRATAAQFGLSASERTENLTDAFEIGTGLLNGRASTVLLLDDIYTTGATARTAAATLRRQQISVYGIVTIARALFEPQPSEWHDFTLQQPKL